MSGTDDHQKLQTAIVLQQKGNLNEAARLYRIIIGKNPNNFHALQLLGIIEATVGNIEQAKLLMARSLLVEPPNIQFIENYATILFKTGDYQSAIQICQQGFQLNEDNISLLYISAIALLRINKFEESIAQFNKLLFLQPKHIAALNERGSALAGICQYEAALASIEKALALNEKYAEAYLNKGNVYSKLKRYDEAIRAFDEAVSLNPVLPDVWLGRGNVFWEVKRYDQALDAYDRALSLKPDLANAWLGRGNVFFELKRYDQALDTYDKALSLQPNLTNARLGRGHVYDKLKRHEKAATEYAKVLATDPEFPFAKGWLLHQKMLSCDWKEIGDLVTQIDSDVSSGKQSAEPFGYQAVAHSAWDLKRCAEIFAADKYPRSQTPLWHGERYNNDKIRLGYLSGEFRHQATSILMAELFELHDKSRFELFAFDNGWDDGSELRRRINRAFNTIVDISCLDDLQVATTIRQKQIDILVNLNGYFGEQRTRVFSLKPSPIQVSYLGFPGTMGTDYIDYLIADRCVIPPEQQDCYVEKIAYLPDTYQINDTKRRIAEDEPTRIKAMLPEIGVVFCCFNNNYKITPEVFEVWMRLLNKVDGSTLWLLEDNPAAVRNLRGEASRIGIAPERLVFAPRMSLPEHLARHRLADLFLDTVPYNAHTTASDALWAGLPVLTCLGSTFPGRVAASLLRAIGISELITRSLDDYEAMALRLAQQRELLSFFKAKLAHNRETYPLFDSKRLACQLEAAYITMWERQQRGEPPAGFAVPPVLPA
jgi:protein O-GlcNAc transferase